MTKIGAVRLALGAVLWGDVGLARFVRMGHSAGARLVALVTLASRDARIAQP